MTLFLTSHTGGWTLGSVRRPAPLKPDNGLVENLKIRWPENARILLLAADPENFEKNDGMLNNFRHAFPLSDLPIRDITLCDQRNLLSAEHLQQYDVLLLSGGHVPTQNRFFHQIHLPDKLHTFHGLVIGISAGSMNCAETVYAHPELEGEAIDPNYLRFLPGLGLTQLMILPHYQLIKDDILDGLRVFEDIAYPDSHDREFFALTDGSYVLAEKGISTLYGEAYRIRDGGIQQICANGHQRTL